MNQRTQKIQKIQKKIHPHHHPNHLSHHCYISRVECNVIYGAQLNVLYRLGMRERGRGEEE